MIAQADSRKWMACLYNSFLFMEAKIMKMAKKLLAVVLTGVMALSMLTGCALSDKIKANALEDALNNDQVKSKAVAAVSTDEAKKKQEENTKYDYKSELNSVVGKVWGKKDDADGWKAGTVAGFATTHVNKLTEETVGTTKYLVYVIDVTDMKTSKKGEWTIDAVELRKAVTTKGFGANKVKDYNAADDKYTAKFGVDFKSVTTGEGENKTTTDYAIVVFEEGAAA